MSLEWRLLEAEYNDPYLNMALEEAVPTMVGRGVAPETVRLWRNIRAVAIGRFQRVESEVDLEACHRRGVDIVRRFTGGGAVYQDHGNLNYAISLRGDNPLLQGDILQDFQSLSRGVISGLRRLGLKAEYGRNNLIHIDGLKISGIAGSSSDESFFQHGTLLVSTDLGILSEVLGDTGHVTTGRQGVQSVRSPVTSLRNALGSEISLDAVRKALLEGFEEALQVNLVSNRLLREEEEMARRLYETKYSKREWNLQL
jgi:lipoate-protein ligase A